MTPHLNADDLVKLLTYQAKSSLRHGHARHVGNVKASPTYVSWTAMRKRCNSLSRDPQSKYAGRGISYDPRWESFDQFLADMGERPAGTTLDRINNDEGYSAANCQWATPKTQARNRRNAKLTLATATEVAVRRLRGESCASLSKAFGISESLPREIVKGRTWPDALASAKEIIAND